MDKNKKQRILLLGGEGFVGRNLAEYLSVRSDCFSIGEESSLFIDRKDVYLSGNPYNDKIPNNYDVIIHLIDNKRCSLDKYINEEKKLVENIALKSQNHLILFSSAVIYANPSSEYGIRKSLLEDFYVKYCEENGIKLTIVRLFNTFGPFQLPYRRGSLIASLIYNHLEGKTTEIDFMDAERDFIYSRDIAQYVAYCIDNEVTGTFDLGSGRLASVKDMIELLEKEIFQTKINIFNKKLRENISSPRAKKDKKVTLRETGVVQALKETVKFYQDYKEIIHSVC